MKQIKAIPKLVFDKHFTDKEFKYYDYACFISILDIDNNEQKFDKSIDNFLQVKMWDIEEDLFENGDLKYEKPNDNELKNIVDFINKHKDKSVFIVHCSAGISRSGAVATQATDRLAVVGRGLNVARTRHGQPSLALFVPCRHLRLRSNLSSLNHSGCAPLPRPLQLEPPSLARFKHAGVQPNTSR